MQCYYLAIKCTEVKYKSVVCVWEGGSLLEYLRFLLLVTCKVSAGSLKCGSQCAMVFEILQATKNSPYA